MLIIFMFPEMKPKQQGLKSLGDVAEISDLAIGQIVVGYLWSLSSSILWSIEM